MARALVVFQRDNTHPLAWLLHPEFRHCFCAIDDGLYWVVVDGCRGLPVVKVAVASDYDLAGYYRAKGHAVVEAERGQGIRGPLAAANCVGLVKSVLGIRAPFIWTPRQLFHHLRSR